MYKCDICGRELNKKIRYHGYTLCPKHYQQYLKHGKFLDNIQRTTNDLNDYEIKDGIAYFNVYNQRNEFVGQFIVDACDVEKVKYHKWRFSRSHVATGNANVIDLSHIILDIPIEKNYTVVDHINGDAKDNRRCNLRICTQSQNVLNKSFVSNNTSGFIGVSYKKDRNRYDPEIRLGYVRCHLGSTKTLEEAVYKRYVAEQLLYKEFANQEEQSKKYEFTKNLPQEIKDELYKIVIQKIEAKNLRP